MTMRLIALALAALLAGRAHAATVAIDTGHSPTRAGVTAADGRGEFEMNRILARAVIARLQARGHRVIDVHAIGADRTLSSRAAAAKGADLLVSIHHDSIQQAWLDAGHATRYGGFSVFLSGRNAQVQRSWQCAAALGEAMLAAGERPSLYHATPIPGENRPLLDAARGVHRFDNLVVLKAAPTAAVLLEAGVIINPNELPRLRDPRWIANTAAQIVAGIERCTSPSAR